MFDDDLLQMTLDANPTWFGDDSDFIHALLEDDNETEGRNDARGNDVSAKEDPGRLW